jgi:transcriptional regulator with XRE-family HTH domain
MENETRKARPLAPRTIAGFVRLQRAIYGWKQQTLASKAGVSLSTVERVERAKTVQAASLVKLAVALNQRPGAFTEPRIRLSKQEALKELVGAMLPLIGTVPVNVAPLRTELQLRRLSASEIGITTSDIEEAQAEVDAIREWLDLASFVRAQDGVTIFPKRERSFPMRQLYRDVLDHVAEVERRHRAVCLVGQYVAKGNLPAFETTKVGVIALRSRDHNPAAAKIRQLFAPESVDTRGIFQLAIEDV